MTYKPQLNRLGILALIILIPGCIWGSVQHDRTLKKEMIKNIEAGKATRMNILEWFGPPAILAKTEGMVSFPALKPDDEAMRKFDSIVFFKYFLKRHVISEHHAVYYYFDEWEKINGISIPIGNTLISLPLTSTDLQFSELWVLVNQKTGQVEDYVFLEREEN
jgi:hypothetical protein